MSADPLTISLDEPLKTFVLRQAAAEGYQQPCDYVSALIETERRRRAGSELEAMLIEGVQSGPPIQADEVYWQESRRKLGLPPRY